MKKMETFLTPIPGKLPPPKHTELEVRCFTCKKFPVCNIRVDYLKTAQLIQNVLGNPCENLELQYVPCCFGTTILDAYKFLPTEIKTDKDEIGKLYGVKYETTEKYNIIYKIGDYLVNFSAEYVFPELKLKKEVDEETMFSTFDIEKYLQPPVKMDGEEVIIGFTPYGFNLSQMELEQANNIIDGIQDGNFSVSLNGSFDIVLAKKFEGEEDYRFPIGDEIKSDDVHTNYTNVKILLYLNKENGVTKLQDIEYPIVIARPDVGDKFTYDNTFKDFNCGLTKENSQEIFNLLFVNTTEPTFKIEEGEELCYKVKYKLSSESEKELIAGLIKLREHLIEELSKNKDIINTTAFSARLECHFYDWERGLSYIDGLKRMMVKYPCGIPLDDKTYYHLATFHIEPNEVPCYHPENGHPVFMPMPYPVMIPPACEPKKHCKPPKTRFEKNEF